MFAVFPALLCVCIGLMLMSRRSDHRVAPREQHATMAILAYCADCVDRTCLTRRGQCIRCGSDAVEIVGNRAASAMSRIAARFAERADARAGNRVTARCPVRPF